MELQGIVEHEVQGRTYVYRPRLSEEQVSRSMVERLVDELFGGSPAALVSHLLESSEVDPGELEQIQKLIQEHEALAGKSPARRAKPKRRRGRKEDDHA